MAEIRVARVDERDNNWERYDPRFRVYLHGSGATSTHGWTDTYDITGATILQVIDWAQRQAGGVLTYSVALVHDDSDRERMQPGHGHGLIWLVGMDGNDTVDEPDRVRDQAQMLERRSARLAIPPADQMPEDVPDPYNDGTERR